MRRPIILMLLLAAVAVADSVRSLDGKVYDGKASIDPVGIAVQPKGNQPPVKLPFAQLLRVRFDGTEAVDIGDSAEAWSAADIGETPQAGSHKFNKNQLTVETAGHDVGGRADSCRLVYQGFRGNGEVSTRLTGAGQWRDRTAAGIMLRGGTDPAAQSVALLLSRDNGLVMVVRPAPGFDSTITQLGKLRAPLYLRLTRDEVYVRAYRSPDGKLWTKLAEAKVNLGENPIGGAAVASREAGMSAPVFESLRLAPTEVPGAVPVDLQETRVAVRVGKEQVREDGKKQLKINQLTFSRGLPDGGTSEMRFQLEGKYSILTGQAYIADKDNGNGAVSLQIFADDEKIFDTGRLSVDTGSSMSFNLPIAGKRDLRLVATDAAAGKTFSYAGFRSVNLTALKPTRSAPRSQGAQIVATDGAVYSGAELRRVSAERVEFSRGNRRDLSVATAEVARILLPGFEPKMAEQIPENGSGVVLPNGDFYEGGIERFDAAGRVQVNSVIFGPREFSLRGDIVALVLRPLASEVTPAAYEVQAADGTVLPAASLSTEGSNLAVNDKHLGKVVIDARSIREIRYGGDRLKWVSDLRPRRVNPGPGRSAAESFVIDATPLGPNLRLLDTDCERGVSLSTGTSVGYDIDGKYNTLLCIAGVPAEVLPTAPVVFVIEIDGKEAFRSGPRNSIQDPMPITVDTTGAKNVTFRVESPPSLTLPAVGVFGDPLLIKSSP